MKYLIIPVCLLLMAGCKKDHHDNNAYDGDVLDVKDTELAPVPDDIQVTDKDSLAILEYWKKFKTAFLKRDSVAFKKMSYENVRIPSYNEYHKSFDGDILVSSEKVMNAPYIDLYQKKFFNFLDTAKFRLRISEYKHSGNKSDTILDSTKYVIWVAPKEAPRNEGRIWMHNFYFTKICDDFKFTNLWMSDIARRKTAKFKPGMKLYFPLDEDTSGNINTSEMFENLQEPVLYNYGGEKIIYRVSWIGSFGFPIIMRIENDHGIYSMYVKRLYRMAWPAEEISTLMAEKKVMIGWFEWYRISEYFNVIRDIKPKEPEAQWTDGAGFLFESINNKKFRETGVQESTDNPQFFALTDYLLSLAGLSEKSKYTPKY